MCNYKFTEINGLEKEFEIEGSCEIEGYINKLNKYLPEENRVELPFDEKGICLFHSDDFSWKEKNNCNGRLAFLLKETATLQKGSLTDLDLREIKTTKKALLLENIDFKQVCVNFSGSHFEGPVNIKNCKFDRDLDLTVCQFTNTLDISDCDFYGVRWHLSYFAQVFNMNKCSFVNHALFDNSTFVYNFNINRCDFNGVFGFKNVDVNTLDYDLGSQFIDVKFSNASFSEANIDTQIIFQNLSISGDFEFIDTTFCEKQSLDFIDIELKGNWYLKSTDPEKKLFKNTCYFLVRGKNISGVIHFQNADVRNIPSEQLENLKRLEKEGKVVFGEGCLKYRVQTAPRIIEVGKKNQNLVIEFVFTFIRFFNIHEGKNLGVEIISKTANTIKFFYYSDQLIEEKEFEEILMDAEKRFWLLGSNTDSHLPMLNSIIYNEAELLISKISILMKIQLKDTIWNLEDTTALINSIGSNQNTISSADLHLDFKREDRATSTVMFINNFHNNAPIIDSNFIINRIENYSDYSSHNVPKEEIEALKQSLINAFKHEGNSLKIELEKIVKNEISNVSIKDFLADFNVAIGQNISASLLYEMIKYFLFL